MLYLLKQELRMVYELCSRALFISGYEYNYFSANSLKSEISLSSTDSPHNTINSLTNIDPCARHYGCEGHMSSFGLV